MFLNNLCQRCDPYTSQNAQRFPGQGRLRCSNLIFLVQCRLAAWRVTNRRSLHALLDRNVASDRVLPEPLVPPLLEPHDRRKCLPSISQPIVGSLAVQLVTEWVLVINEETL